MGRKASRKTGGAAAAKDTAAGDVAGEPAPTAAAEEAAETVAAASPAARDEKKLPRGRPASGRNWKQTQTKKSSMQVYDATRQLKTSWEKKLDIKRKRERAKELQQEVEEAQRERRGAEKRRIEERRKRREANEMKAGKFQVIADPSKIKKMSKKQLRMIRKTEVDKHGNVRLVSPWS